MLAPATLLLLILSLLSERLQAWLRARVTRRPATIFLAPALLSVFFALAAWHAGAASARLDLLVLAYTLAPTLAVFLSRRTDLAVILLLWLPLEMGAGANLVPRPAQGYLHAVAYGVAITLGLSLFLIFRGLAGMKYNLPRSTWDALNPLLGFVVAAPVLIGLGRALGFLDPFHLPHVAWLKIGVRYLVIFCATALPEEILFRALIQNWIMRRFGANWRTLAAAALVFGCAHLNNGPQPLPNWRYGIVATVAGVVFGRVFQKSSTILSSVSLHAAINTIKWAWF